MADNSGKEYWKENKWRMKVIEKVLESHLQDYKDGKEGTSIVPISVLFDRIQIREGKMVNFTPKSLHEYIKEFWDPIMYVSGENVHFRQHRDHIQKFIDIHNAMTKDKKRKL